MSEVDRIEAQWQELRKLRAILGAVMDLEKLAPAGDPYDPTSWTATVAASVVAGKEHNRVCVERDAALARIASLERELADWRSRLAMQCGKTLAAMKALEPFAKMATDIDESELGAALHDEGALLVLARTWETPIGNPSVGDLRRAARVHASLSTATTQGDSDA